MYVSMYICTCTKISNVSSAWEWIKYWKNGRINGNKFGNILRKPNLAGIFPFQMVHWMRKQLEKVYIVVRTIYLHAANDGLNISRFTWCVDTRETVKQNFKISKFYWICCTEVNFFLSVENFCGYSPVNHSVHTVHPKYSWNFHIILTCHCDTLGKTDSHWYFHSLFALIYSSLLLFFLSSLVYYLFIFLCFFCFSCLFLLHLTYSRLWDSFVRVTWTWVEITLSCSFSYIWNFVAMYLQLPCLSYVVFWFSAISSQFILQSRFVWDRLHKT